MMTGSGCHEDLIVWNTSVELASAVYAASRQLPRDERFGLGLELRRAALAVSSNVALGCARRARGEFVQCMRLARGSLCELETQVLIASRAVLLSDCDTLLRLIREIDRRLLRSIERQANPALAAHAKGCTAGITAGR